MGLATAVRNLVHFEDELATAFAFLCCYGLLLGIA